MSLRLSVRLQFHGLVTATTAYMIKDPCHLLCSMEPCKDISVLFCSVGGLDYGTVRTGAFMGLQLLSNAEESLSRQSSYRVPAWPSHDGLENGDSHHAIGLSSPHDVHVLTQHCCVGMSFVAP